VIDWTQAYKFSADALLPDGLQDDGLGNAHMSPATCEKFKPHNAQLVDDAIAHLSRVEQRSFSNLKLCSFGIVIQKIIATMLQFQKSPVF
jgi:hypothetical protein